MNTKIFENKIVKIISKILVGILAFIAIFLIGVRIYFNAPVSKYNKMSKKAFVIPGIKDGYIAQGISYDPSTDCFFLTGYMNDHSASPIYIVNKTTKKVVNVIRMSNPDGTEFTGHAGGLSVMGNKVYVAGSGDCCLYVFNKADLESAPKNSSVAYTSVVNLKSADDGIGVAFTAVQNDLIFAGEFYRDVVYPTRESHHIASADGTNKAIAVGFSLDGDIATPQIAYSLPKEIQGMCFAPDGIYLTRSWGAAFSNVYKFAYEDLQQKGTFSALGKEVPLYILDSSNMKANYKTAPMAEEIEYVDGRFYITNESASNKYIFGKFTGGRWCRSTKF